MTTANDEQQPRQPWWQWVAHRYIAITVAYLLGCITLDVVPLSSLPSTTATTLLVAVWLTAIVYVVPMHDRRLCERCIETIPLDPNAAVERYAWRLRMIHRWRDQTNIKALMWGGVFWASTLGLSLVLHAPIVSTIVFGVVTVVVISAARTHSQLQPWCPYCRRDDDDEEEEAPEPTGPPENTEKVTL